MIKCLFKDSKGFTKIIELSEPFPVFELPIMKMPCNYWVSNEGEPRSTDVTIDVIRFRYYNMDETGLYVYLEDTSREV